MLFVLVKLFSDVNPFFVCYKSLKPFFNKFIRLSICFSLSFEIVEIFKILWYYYLFWRWENIYFYAIYLYAGRRNSIFIVFNCLMKSEGEQISSFRDYSQITLSIVFIVRFNFVSFAWFLNTFARSNGPFSLYLVNWS
jgi:hypothetical protein